MIGFEGYYKVSSDGDVFSIRNNKIISQRICGGKSTKYFGVGLFVNGKSFYKTVHSIVAQNFIGERPDKFDIDHIDNNSLNNRADNLRYVSRSENIKKTFSGKRLGVGLMNKTKKPPQRYRADIWIYGRRYFLGSFTDINKAIRIYNETHKEFFGYN